MRKLMIAALSLYLILAAGSAWAYSATLKVEITNNDYETYEIDIEYPGGDEFEALDSGDSYDYTYDATAWAWDAETYEVDVYVDEYDTGYERCYTSIAIETWWDFGVKLGQCTATAAQTTACTIEASSSGTTCTVTVTIND